MLVRGVVGFVVVIFLGLEGLAQQNESYLVAVNIGKSADVRVLENMQLSIYYQYEDVLVTELATPQLSLLRDRGFAVTILDENPARGSYSMLSAAGRPLRGGDAGSGRVLFRHPDGWIVRDYRPGVAENAGDGLIAAPMRKTDWRFAAERAIPAVSLRADLDSLVAQIVSQVDADTVRSFVQAMQDLGTRYCFAANRDAVADWIRGQFVRMGYAEVVLDSFQFGGSWQKNVVATLPSATSSDEVIVIGGHHDSITGVDPMNYAPGADDNASGTTAVLEIARVLKLLDFKPQVTFKFVTFAAEERGLHGSHDYAEKALQSGMKIRLMINHDMISHTLSPVESSTFDINYYTGSAGYRELARVAGQKFSVVAPRTGEGNPTNSDSYSFWVRGFRAVYFEESDFSYPYYHTPNDVISNYSMEYCAEVIKASCATLVASSMLPSEVRDIVVSDRGDGSSLLVRWAESRDFDHGEYIVGLGTASGVYDSLITTSDTSVVLAGLDEGVTYYVGVTSVDVEGYESYLAESSGIPYTIPRPPDRFRAHPEWHEVVLSWSPPKETDLLGYNVFRSTAPGGPAVQLNNAILPDTLFVDNSAQNGVYYYYHAIAVDSGLNESQAAPVQKSRVVSLDQGLLLVDETKDGDGSPQNPTDAQTDAFYEALLEGFPVTHHDVSEEGSVGLADLGAHSTVFWYGDDISEMAVPLAAANEVKEYLDHGGRFFYAGYKPARAFSGNPALEAEFGPGDVVHDYLKIRATENGLFSLFRGAVAAGGGYSDVSVDSSKAGSASQFHLKNIETVFAASGGTEIYTYDSGFDTASALGALRGNPVGVEYLGQDYRTVVLTFPLYAMGENQARALVQHVLLEKFSEPTGVEPVAAGLPSSFALHQNYPNPFNPSTRIAFDLPVNTRVSLKVFDLLGRAVATLLDEQMQAGRHIVSWNAEGMPSGVYFTRLDAGRFSGTRKLLLMK